MKITSVNLEGVQMVEIDPHEDERGLFARTWDSKIARENGLLEQFDYMCISTNTKKYTLRGMHYQLDPHGETKLVRCTKGSMFDVAIDLRPDSPTFKQWFGTELTDANHKALYIPTGYAHGFLTRSDNTEVLYCIAGEYNANAATGVRFDDPAFNIKWPAAPQVISDRDAVYPDFKE